MDKSKLKLKAIELRKKGLSYREIGEKLSVTKSTIRFWCMNVRLRPEDKKRLYTRQVLLMARGPKSQKERRKREIIKIVKGAEKEIRFPVSFEAYRLFGAGLYWAEGNKTGGFEITNSDPYFILFMVKWFEKILNVNPSRLKAKLNIYSQQDDLKLKKFWAQLTNIPLKNFNKSYVKPSNKGYKKNNLYYGTIKIRVSKGTDFRHKVFGWVKATLKDIDSQTELVQREWKSLRDVPRPINMPENIKLPR
jgi:DNA-binding CsgD family transcriptional regulator